MCLDEDFDVALGVVTAVRDALAAEYARGAIRCPLWVNETESLRDYLDLVVANLDQMLPASARERGSVALITLRIAKGVLRSANERGDLHDTLWADQACTLFDFIDLSIEQLLTLRRALA